CFCEDSAESIVLIRSRHICRIDRGLERPIEVVDVFFSSAIWMQDNSGLPICVERGRSGISARVDSLNFISRSIVVLVSRWRAKHSIFSQDRGQGGLDTTIQRVVFMTRDVAFWICFCDQVMPAVID